MNGDEKDKEAKRSKKDSSIVPISTSLLDDDDEGRSVLMRSLKKQIEKQRELLNKTAESEYNSTGELKSLRLREEMDRFNEIAARYQEEAKRYVEQEKKRKGSKENNSDPIIDDTE